MEYYELYKFYFEIRMFCDSGDFQIRKHLKLGNEVEGSNCFNIAWLFICSAPFLAKACVSPGRGPTRRSKSLAILPEITFSLQSKEGFQKITG